jgi:hypothetical protein
MPKVCPLTLELNTKTGYVHGSLASSGAGWCLQVAEMQQKRGSHASTVAFDQVFALGGWDANAFLVRSRLHSMSTGH